MSHTSHEVAKTLHVETIRAVAEAHVAMPIGILCDLQGPKFRLGEFAGGRVFVNDGATFVFDHDETPGSAERVFLPHPQIFEAVEPGHMLLLDDGKIRMRVIERRQGPHRRDSRHRRRAVEPQGHQPARHAAAGRAR